jgi:hypothetical protein
LVIAPLFRLYLYPFDPLDFGASFDNTMGHKRWCKDFPAILRRLPQPMRERAPIDAQALLLVTYIVVVQHGILSKTLRPFASMIVNNSSGVRWSLLLSALGLTALRS